MDIGYTWVDFILRIVCAYTKLGWQRMKGVYDSGKMNGGTILNLVTSAIRAGYVLMIEGLPK